MATPGSAMAPWAGYTTIAKNRNLDTWLPSGRTTPDIPTYLANNARFNVRDFGATGGGSVDDTLTVQAAITAAGNNPSLSGGCVYFPPGVYLITAPLVIPPLVTLLGDATQVTEIQAQGCSAMTVSPSAANGPTIIKGLIIYCVGASTATNYTGISIPGTQNIIDKCVGLIIDDCQITNFNVGIFCRTLWWSAIRNTNIYNCWNALQFRGLCVGVDVANVNGVLATSGGFIGSGTSTGVYLDQDTYTTGGAQQPQAIHFTGGQFSGFGYGCNHSLALQTTYDAVAFDQCTVAPVRFVYGAGTTSWIGCYFGLVGTATGQGFVQLAVGVAGTGQCIVRGSSFYNSSTGAACIGFLGAALQVNTIIEECFFTGWTGSDISLSGNSGGGRVLNNACTSTGITNSIVISASANTIVFGNTCAAAIVTVAPLTQLPPLGGAAAPTTGAHVVGELMWLQNPVASGFLGYVCTAAGTPGTWQRFGFIGPNLSAPGTITAATGLTVSAGGAAITGNSTVTGSLAVSTGFGANGASPQIALASGGAAPAGGTGATAGAYDTAAHRDALITLVNNMRTALVANGIMT